MISGYSIGEVKEADLDTVRQLFGHYARSLPFDLGYQGFEDEVASLPLPYVAPSGVLLVARGLDTGDVIGMVGLKRLTVDVAEIKRLYVRPAARGGGTGRALLESAIIAASRLRYRRVRLDSHRPSMGAAIAMYRKLGFAEIEPYGAEHQLGEDICFFEFVLR